MDHYIVEWDWWWDTDTWLGPISLARPRPNDYFCFMRNGQDQKFSWLIFKNDAKAVKMSQNWPTDLKKWYRFQLSVIDQEYILKGKERSDDTLSEKIKPIMDWKHNAHKQGQSVCSVPSHECYGTIWWCTNLELIHIRLNHQTS